MSRNACLAPKDARAYRKTDAVCVSARAALRSIPQDFPKTLIRVVILACIAKRKRQCRC